MPTVLLCTSTSDDTTRAFTEAAQRTGVALRVVADAVDADAVVESLAGAPIDGVLATGERPAVIAAQVAQRLGLTWHAPDAVIVASHGLLARGRLLAAGLPVPWFVSVPARGDEDLDRLARVRFPCVIGTVGPVAPAAARATVRVHSLEQLLAARDRLAAWLARRASSGTPPGDADTLLVEAVVPGQPFAVDGVLEHGALRVFALFEVVDSLGDVAAGGTMHVTPARVAPARQAVIAGHVARAALALGLHHGPVHATCRADGDDVVGLDVAPYTAHPRTRAIPVIAPDRSRCAIEDVLLAHAGGRPIERYGHEAIASGVLALTAPHAGRLREVEGLDAARGVEWVTRVETTIEVGALVGGPSSDGGYPVVCVFAQGVQPGDVIATLQDASARLRIVVDREVPTTTA